MRHFKHIALSAATGLAALLTFTHPASAAGSVELKHEGERVFQLRSTQLEAHGSQGAPGEEFVVRGNLLHGNSPVGTFGESCAVIGITVNDTDLQCTGTFSLPHGQITFQGRNTIPNNPSGPVTAHAAITGGTGHYRTAQGFIDAVINTDLRFTIHLIR